MEESGGVEQTMKRRSYDDDDDGEVANKKQKLVEDYSDSNDEDDNEADDKFNMESVTDSVSKGDEDYNEKDRKTEIKEENEIFDNEKVTFFDEVKEENVEAEREEMIACEDDDADESKFMIEERNDNDVEEYRANEVGLYNDDDEEKGKSEADKDDDDGDGSDEDGDDNDNYGNSITIKGTTIEKEEEEGDDEEKCNYEERDESDEDDKEEEDDNDNVVEAEDSYESCSTCSSEQEPEDIESVKMQILVSNFSEDQLNRYTLYRRSTFPKAAVKRLMQAVSGVNVPQNLVIAMAGIAKVLAAQVIETALDVQEEWKEGGSPVNPHHIREGLRRVRATKKLHSTKYQGRLL